MRRESRERAASETGIRLHLGRDPKPPVSEARPGFGLLPPTLTAFWGGIHLQVLCGGDTHSNAHHSAEALCLGQALLAGRPWLE